MRFVAIALTLAALGLAGATQAPAAEGPNRLPFSSKISIHSAELHFSGRVRSVYSPCRARRRVVLFQVVQGGPDQALGRTRTDGRGRWSIRVSGFAGISLARFYALVRPGREQLAHLPILCSPARSRTIRAAG